MTIKLHRKIAQFVAEMKKLEREQGIAEQTRYMVLEERLERLYHEYRQHHGFNYNPLFYEGRQER